MRVGVRVRVSKLDEIEEENYVTQRDVIRVRVRVRVGVSDPTIIALRRNSMFWLGWKFQSTHI